jgi:ABC-type polysaccharide/polyol phosphate export permease
MTSAPSTQREPVAIVRPGSLAAAWSDVVAGARRWRVWTFLGWRDIAGRYQRSFIGPLWLTITTAIFLTAIGIVYSRLFGQNVDDYLPYLAAGVIVWLYLTAVLTELATAYTSSIHFVLNLPGPKSVYPYRVLLRNVIVLAHNLPVWVVVAVVFGVPVTPATLLVVPGLLIATASVFFAGVALAVVSAKVRDLPVVLASVLQVLFFVTPVMWSASLLPADAHVVLALNPFVPLLDVVREPLLGQAPDAGTWLGSLFVLGCCVVLGVIVFARYRRRLAFWL